MSFAAVLGAYAVEKIFFTAAGAFIYLYLFLTVGGSFDIKFGWVTRTRPPRSSLFGGGALLIMMLVRRYWPKVVEWWDKAKEGGAILGNARRVLRSRVPALVHQLAAPGSAWSPCSSTRTGSRSASTRSCTSPAATRSRTSPRSRPAAWG